MLLEKRVKGVKKIEEKERNHTKILEEASKMAGNLTIKGHIDGVINHGNKIKTNEFDNFHEWASEVRYMGVETQQLR